jgi:hypothetical protein
MNNQIIYDRQRCHNQSPGKIQIVLAGAGAPSSSDIGEPDFLLEWYHHLSGGKWSFFLNGLFFYLHSFSLHI